MLGHWAICGLDCMDINYTIVVGVDGSLASRRALRWAVREVASRGGVVKAITVWHPTRNTIDEGALEEIGRAHV